MDASLCLQRSGWSANMATRASHCERTKPAFALVRVGGAGLRTPVLRQSSHTCATHTGWCRSKQRSVRRACGAHQSDFDALKDGVAVVVDHLGEGQGQGWGWGQGSVWCQGSPPSSCCSLRNANVARVSSATRWRFEAARTVSAVQDRAAQEARARQHHGVWARAVVGALRT